MSMKRRWSLIVGAIALAALTGLLMPPASEKQHGSPPLHAAAASNGIIRGLSIRNGLVQSVSAGLVQSGDMVATGLAAGSYGDGSHVGTITTDSSGRLTGFSQALLRDVGGRDFNLFAAKYGVSPANSDNSQGLQAWLNDVCAAGGVGYVPQTTGYIQFRTPLVIQPPNGQTTVTIKLIGCANQQNILPVQFLYIGNNSNSVFTYKGIYNCEFENIGVILDNNESNVVCHDFQFSSGMNNCPNNLWKRCMVLFNGCTNCVGFRIGQDTSGNSNGPWTTYEKCTVNDQGPTNGNVGYQLGGPEAYGTEYKNCNGAFLAQLMLSGSIYSTTTGTTGISDTTINVVSTTMFAVPCVIAINFLGSTEQILCTGKTATSFTGCTRGYNGTTAQAYGSGSVTNLYVTNQGVYTGQGFEWNGGGGSGNGANLYGGDFQAAASLNQTRIIKTRNESGWRFFQWGVAGNQQSGMAELSGNELASYSTPTDAFGVISLTGHCQCYVKGLNAYNNASSFDSRFITNAKGQTTGSITMENCTLYGSWPIYNNHQTGWNLRFRNIQFTNQAASALVGLPINQDIIPPVVLTDAATVTVDLSQGTQFLLPMTAAVGASRTLTLANATPASPRFTVFLQQPVSGGPCAPTFWTTKWPGGSPPTWSTAGSLIDRVDFDQPSSGVYLGTATLGYQ